MLYFFVNDTATTEIYTLSLHDALPISHEVGKRFSKSIEDALVEVGILPAHGELNVLAELLAHVADDAREAAEELVNRHHARSEEHTSELQSRQYLVCRLLLEKKKNTCL